MAAKNPSRISDYDSFVAYCTSEFRRRPEDEALRYFDNRFYNRRVDNQTGHLRQAFYAAKEFFSRQPDAKKMGPGLVSQGRLQVDRWDHLKNWISFVRSHERVHLPEGGDMETVYKILPTNLGGLVKGGGGAGPSFKVVLPLVARYMAERRGETRALIPVGADAWEDIKEERVRPAERARFITSRIIRDSRKSIQLKDLYGHYCQVCQRRIEVRRGDYYSEAHHLQPLGGRHTGPDIKPNMLVLCPWHHAEFDYFLFHIDSHHNLRHRLRKLVSTESRLIFQGGHRIGQEFMDYNNTYYRKLAANG